MKCPQCKGTGELSVEFVMKGKHSAFPVTCITCDGSGQVTKAQEKEYRNALAMWCECGNPSEGTSYVPDNASSVCVKHHWVCGDCGRVVQVG